MITRMLKPHSEKFSVFNHFLFRRYLPLNFVIFLKTRLPFNRFYCLFNLQTRHFRVNDQITSGLFSVTQRTIFTSFRICVTELLRY